MVDVLIGHMSDLCTNG